MEIVPQNIAQYAEEHSTAEDEVLIELNKETHKHYHAPQMLSGHLQGKILEFLSKLVSPERILEVGTYTGYSAICLAKGLQKQGKLITIDKDKNLKNICDRYFQKSGLADKIEQQFGDAMEIVPKLNETIDMAYIDADKANYLNYFKMLLPKLRKGGIILTDNVLWSGKVTNPDEREQDKRTRAIHRFNEYVAECKEVETVMLPVRDGIMFTRKLQDHDVF